MRTKISSSAFLLFVLCSGTTLAADGKTPTGKISFKKVQIDTVFRSEGVAVANYNGDGKLDIAAGSVYYTATGKCTPLPRSPRASAEIV